MGINFCRSNEEDRNYESRWAVQRMLFVDINCPLHATARSLTGFLAEKLEELDRCIDCLLEVDNDGAILFPWMGL